MRLARYVVPIVFGVVPAAPTIGYADALADDRGGLGGVAAAIELLKEPDEAERVEAAQRLAGLGAAAGQAIPALVFALQDRSARVRIAAADALYLVSGRFEAVEREVAAALGNGDSVVRFTALGVVSNAGAEARALLPKIIPMIEYDHEWLIRDVACEAAASMGSLASSAVPVLTGALFDPEPTVVLSAARALARIGPGAATAVADLERIGRVAGDPDVRRTAREAVRAILASVSR